MPTDHDQLARLEVAAITGHLPPDLGAWIVTRLANEFAADDRRAQRDELLRQAARLLDGTITEKSKQLQIEAKRLNRRPMVTERHDFPGLLCRALQRNGGALPGPRQLRRILDSDTRAL